LTHLSTLLNADGGRVAAIVLRNGSFARVLLGYPKITFFAIHF